MQLRWEIRFSDLNLWQLTADDHHSLQEDQVLLTPSQPFHLFHSTHKDIGCQANFAIYHVLQSFHRDISMFRYDIFLFTQLTD